MVVFSNEPLPSRSQRYLEIDPSGSLEPEASKLTALRFRTLSRPPAGILALIAVTWSCGATRPGFGVTFSAAVGAWFGGGGGGLFGSVLGIARALPAVPSRIAAVRGRTAVRRSGRNIGASRGWVAVLEGMLRPRPAAEYAP